MRAAVLVAPFQLEVQEVPTPESGPRQALVRVLSASVCGSDVHAFQGHHPRNKPGSWFGHEIAGEVAGLGEGVSRLRVGQRAAVDGVLPCGDCSFCREGRGNLCLDYRTTGARRDGALAEYTVVPAENVYPIPDHITMDQAALVQPLSIAYHGVRQRADVREGETVVIMGAGPVGLACLVHCNAVGARALVFDLRDARLEMARRMGAAGTVDLRTEDPLAAVHDCTDGLGAHHTIECVGGEQDETLRLACKTTRKGGTITVLGSSSLDAFSLLTDAFRRGELTLKASHSYVGRDAYAACLALVTSGRIDPSPLVTHVYPLARAQEALEKLSRGDQDVVKAVIRPQE